MNMFTSNKKTKKFILVLVLFILFGFCFPQKANAALELEDFPAIPAKIFYVLEKGVLKYLNNIFTNDEHHTHVVTENEDYNAESYEIFLTPENIIKGKFILFDANIFKDISNSSDYYDDGALNGVINSGKTSLRNIIAGWYYALRNLAIVALLSVLVYVGIRMILSTVAQDKAKYKVMFKDWLVALCLVVIMHYMMIGILNICSDITKALGGGENATTIGKLTERISGVLSEKSPINDNGGKDWFDKHYAYTDDEGTYDMGDAYAYILVLAGIIIYTFIFAVKYLKREFTIIFLVLLGPVSCITYPIDKISDGKAQAFNKWFSEFLYQVIIQPFHLLLYIVLVGSAVELANANVIYALVCFAVMIPAEKFVKEMFGFRDKLGSPLGAFASGALASKAISALTGKGKGTGSGGKDNTGDNNSTPNELPPKTVDKAGLVGGNDDGENDSERGIATQRANQILESGETPGGNASASDAYQDSEDPIADTERDFLGTGQDKEDAQQENNNEEDNSSNGQSKWDKVKAIHNERVSKKYGDTDRKQRWINRGKKIAPKLLKGALKAGSIGMVGTMATAGALLTGNGKEALGIAAGIGAYAGKKAISGGKKAITGAKGAVKDYKSGLRSNDEKEKKAFKAFKADKKQVDKAVLSYRKNHNGVDPNYEQLNQEMQDRFALSRFGFSDDQIDDAVGSFQKLRDIEGVEENDALNETAYATKLASDYSKKDYRSAKTMQEAIDTIAGDFEKYGVRREVAEQNARKYLTQSAQIKGVEIALPDETIKLKNTTQKSATSTDMQIKVKEGNIKIEEAGQGSGAKRKVTASVDFVENPENRRKIEQASSEKKGMSEDLEIVVGDGNAKKQIDRTRKNREDIVKETKTSPKDARVESLELNDKVSKNAEVMASKGKVQKQANEMMTGVSDELNEEE